MAVKMSLLECPRCKADLEIEDDLDVFYCKYCGAKIMVQGRDKNTVNEKVRMKEIDTASKMHSDELQYKKYVYDEENKKNKIGIITGLLLFFMPVIMMVFYYNTPRYLEKRKLEKIESEVQTLINEGDYDNAFFKAIQLSYNSDENSEIGKDWKRRRADYIKMIEDLERKEAAKIATNILPTRDCIDYINMNYADVQAEFASAGFTNIELIPIKRSGMFRVADNVDHVTIDGNILFTVQDYFDKDSRVVICYYK